MHISSHIGLSYLNNSYKNELWVLTSQQTILKYLILK